MPSSTHKRGFGSFFGGRKMATAAVPRAPCTGHVEGGNASERHPPAVELTGCLHLVIDT